MQHENTSLDGQLLIAMPGMGDPRFEKSVIFICAHSEDGALGLIINKPTEDIEFDHLVEQLEIDIETSERQICVHIGGPVENERGFVLHSSDYSADATTLNVNDEFRMTGTLDVIEALASGAGPKSALLALGYSGWGPGQLEDEILQNGWLTCEADPQLVFSENDEGKWAAALKTLGIDPLSLSSTAGRA